MEEMRVCEKHPPLIEIDRLLKDSRDTFGLKVEQDEETAIESVRLDVQSSAVAESVTFCSADSLER
jgi:hypothetical protein